MLHGIAISKCMETSAKLYPISGTVYHFNVFLIGNAGWIRDCEIAHAMALGCMHSNNQVRVSVDVGEREAHFASAPYT